MQVQIAIRLANKIMSLLREGGIYKLPNGIVLVARLVIPSYYVFHSPVVDEQTRPMYAVDQAGQMLFLTCQPISWQREDLIDTGRTLPIEKLAKGLE